MLGLIVHLFGKMIPSHLSSRILLFWGEFSLNIRKIKRDDLTAENHI